MDKSKGLPVSMLFETSKDEWFEAAANAIADRAALGGTFKTDDLRQAATIPEPRHPNWWGAAFRTAAGRGVIEKAGYNESSTRSRSGGSSFIWKAKEQHHERANR